LLDEPAADNHDWYAVTVKFGATLPGANCAFALNTPANSAAESNSFFMCKNFSLRKYMQNAIKKKQMAKKLKKFTSF
jgi:hypothetical protein